MSDPQANPKSLQQLKAADAAWTVPPRSLHPTQTQATSLVALFGQVLEHAPNLGPMSMEAWAAGMAGFVGAVQTHFPENLFLDLDGLGMAVAREGVVASATVFAERPRDATAAARIGEILRVATGLQAVFGSEGGVGFRYTHDYIYGFDWARWVAADPTHRAGIGPYDLVFQTRMAQRGNELAAAIATGNDPDYPQLAPGEPRNPFNFPRTPATEAATLEQLAKTGGVPVEAWSPVGRATWSRPFALLREQVAKSPGG